MPPLTLAILGCGSRGRTYAGIAAAQPQRFTINAAADLIPVRRQAVADFAGRDIPLFESADAILAAGKLADILIIATQDADHFPHAEAALRVGYDVLLEKPAAESLERCEELDALARLLGRRVVPCFVLRHTPFYQAVRSFIDSGRLGRPITLRLAEGVEPFHHAHSFVRGHWGNTTVSSPMIVAKCSHDTDLICWLGGAAPKAVSSFGRLDWFHRDNAPPGAPPRCTDGCPAADSCAYDARRYLGDKRRWLRMVMDDSQNASDEAITDFLETSPWGRCVYQCDNDAVDHQVLAIELENGVTATLTMTAFDCGREIEVHGTFGSLRGGDPFQQAGAPELWFRDHATATIEPIPIPTPDDDGYAGHGGGDAGLVNALPTLFRGPDAVPPGLHGFQGHRLAFLAETSRRSATCQPSPRG